MTIAPTSTVVLEPAVQEFAAATADPPHLFDLGPEQGREVVDEVQSGPVAAPAADIEDLSVPGGPTGDVAVGSCAPSARSARCR